MVSALNQENIVYVFTTKVSLLRRDGKKYGQIIR